MEQLLKDNYFNYEQNEHLVKQGFALSQIKTIIEEMEKKQSIPNSPLESQFGGNQ